MRGIGLLLVLAVFLSACRGQRKQAESSAPSGMHLTAQDTAAVETLVGMFMDWAQAGKVDSAVMLLRTAVPNQRPQALGREEFRKAMETFGQFPVEAYEVEYIRFHRAYANEVKCRVRTPDGRSINRYFRPVRYLGRWCLCLKEEGDAPLE